MKIDDHRKQEIQSRHAAWLNDPITQYYVEIVTGQVLKVAAVNGQNAVTPSVSDSVVRVIAGQAKTWDTIRQLLVSSDVLIKNLEEK